MAAVMHMAFSVTVSFVNTRLDNGLALKRWQAIFQTYVDLMKTVALETNVIHDSNPKHQSFNRRKYIWK